jgi:hypothetical protein
VAVCKIKKTSLFTFFFLFSNLAWTNTVFLQLDLGVKGNVRYCKYSDGKTYTFNSMSLCQPSLDVSAPGMGVGMGSLKGEYLDGMTKVCVYDVLGEKKAIRVGAANLCPLTQKF